MVGLIVFVALALNIKVQIYRYYRELAQARACLEVSVWGLVMAGQLLENVDSSTDYGLSKSLQKLYVQVERALLGKGAVSSS